MRKELNPELNKLNEEFSELMSKLRNHPKTKPEHFRTAYSIHRAHMNKLIRKYSDDLQKLNAGETLRIVK